MRRMAKSNVDINKIIQKMRKCSVEHLFTIQYTFIAYIDINVLFASNAQTDKTLINDDVDLKCVFIVRHIMATTAR